MLEYGAQPPAEPNHNVRKEIEEKRFPITGVTLVESLLPSKPPYPPLPPPTLLLSLLQGDSSGGLGPGVGLFGYGWFPG